MKQKEALIFLSLGVLSVLNGLAQKSIWTSREFAVYKDSIVQHEFTAKALSASELVSNYQSPANGYLSPRVNFKFSLNGKDNEMPPGMDHQLVVLSQSGYSESPLIIFGKQYNDTTGIPVDVFLAPNTKLKLKLDLRQVLSEMKVKGYYTTFRGDRIYKEDLKAVFVAGNTTPMIWDFDNLVNHPSLEMKDEDGDGIYETVLTLNTPQDKQNTAPDWHLTKDISAFPQYHSEYPISDAIYNLSLEEMQKAIEPDSTFRTGKEWAGVWTRDISYSIILSMAYLQPKVAENSLLRKVNKNGRIIQDTGSGGAWPVSTDRMIWAVAAFELYKVTGDRAWLKKAYDIIRKSIEDDLNNIYDPVTGLVRGESSFLDWREQTYPKWMQPADIYQSENLGTNAVHFQANMVLSNMAGLLGDLKSAAKYKSNADRIKKGINNWLWQAERGYYGQYRYGRNYLSLSPRYEALGEALTVLFNIADSARQQQIIEHSPLTAYGISCIYPQIPGIPPYHNNAIWPFVQTFWLWAAAKVGDEKAVMESMADIYRPTALFLTNKENFVADNGDFLGTQINSSNMLWSLSGNISIIHKLIFGIRYTTEGLVFQPFVPELLDGKRTVSNFSYRHAVLNIEMEGFGNRIAAFYLDGKQQTGSFIPSSIAGDHQIRIVLASGKFPASSVSNVANAFSPSVPSIFSVPGRLNWQAVERADYYKILKNGIPFMKTTGTSLIVKTSGYSEYQVIAVDKRGLESFASEPAVLISTGEEQVFELERVAPKSPNDYKGFTGEGFVEINRDTNSSISIRMNVKETGLYAIDLRYSNGNGPVNTENKCAIRTVFVNGKMAGTFVLPQRGKGEWSNWGYSNAVKSKLLKGLNTITVRFERYNENMNGPVNQAMLDNMRVIRLQ